MKWIVGRKHEVDIYNRIRMLVSGSEEKRAVHPEFDRFRSMQVAKFSLFGFK